MILNFTNLGHYNSPSCSSGEDLVWSSLAITLVLHVLLSTGLSTEEVFGGFSLVSLGPWRTIWLLIGIP